MSLNTMGPTSSDVKKGFSQAYDVNNDMLKVQSVQKKFRDSFSGASLDTTKWVSSVGTGGSISQASSQLTMASGTTINSETSITSTEVFTVPMRLSIGLILSQRIVNQTFFVEFISVNKDTLQPDGLHCAALVFDGTTATQAKYRVQNGGYTPLDSSANTFPTTASGGIYEIEPFADEAWFHGGTLDSTTARSNSYRRHQQIPDPNAFYKVRLRWLNGGTSPASSTNAVVQYLAIQDYAELTAEITAGRGQSSAGQGMGVNVIGNQTVHGITAQDGVGTSVNPVKVGGRAVNAMQASMSTTGDMVDFVATMTGIQIVRLHANPEAEWQFACSAVVANTTDVVLKAAGAAGIRNYVTSLQVKNTNATATEIVVKDGSTVIWRGHVGASMLNADNIVFNVPLKGTAATALNFACITTGAAVYINAQGYQAP